MVSIFDASAVVNKTCFVAQFHGNHGSGSEFFPTFRIDAALDFAETALEPCFEIQALDLEVEILLGGV